MTEATPEKGNAGAWSEDDKTEFLLRMIAHLKDDSKAINWKEINMRGRSLKSLQGQWTKVNKALAELEKLGDAPMTPSKSPKKATPSKRKSGANEDEGQGNEPAQPPKKAPKKRGRAPAKKTKEDDAAGTPADEKTELKEEKNADVEN
ncbi:hypothetical protein K4F52_009424 [Lecanicillium sp. MT-2017a]|nr:hypothetical protein K4F52_009424 [Lecanicillium sp. MT-2017a]